ncbi:hypothetical protein [Nonomuraea fuscirosea]|uniref:hypothetical protein n=1 Tax=Nonomuraea fuscirosea TaxID=1291556 RepID=UPI0034444F6A
MDDPFAELDQIDWAGLRHAYGPAGDDPGLLRALASDDPGLRAEALGELCTNVFHQGRPPRTRCRSWSVWPCVPPGPTVT